ncbi:DUF6350 family protein [uncultured Corynebacterium sp.]|mgnify:CR=1 FL=1|uniref:cell division protein PerM n=1 Tax=uncultured Corynebacterium sp. TaxID=159447 RepID=UPI0025964054|nr:DUF6350 family protein [uncultured Corynebacterium sp.]
MSNKSSPRSARNRKRPIRARVSAKNQRKAAPKVPQTFRERLRHYLPYVAVPQLVVALAVTLVCFVTILLTGAKLSYLPGAIGSLWLVVHGAPVRYDAITLGAVPLLPVAAVVALFASRIRAATRKRVSVADLGAIAALVAAFSLVLSAVAIFMVGDASTVYAIDLPPLAPAILYPLLTNAVAFVAGMGTVLWRALARRYGVPTAFVDDVKEASRQLLWLAGGALTVYLVALGLGAGRIQELVNAFPVLSAGGKVSLGLLSILYLPNAAMETVGVLLGGAFTYAGGSASLFAVDNVAFPPLPLFAALPPAAAPWAPALLVVPTGLLLYRALKRGAPLIDALATAASLAVLFLLALLYSGGRAGAYGYVGVNPLIAALLALAWSGVIGALVWSVGRLRERRTAAAEAEDEVETETETETGTEEEAEELEQAETQEEPESQDQTEETEEHAETEDETDEEVEQEAEQEPAPGGSTKWVPPETSE